MHLQQEAVAMQDKSEAWKTRVDSLATRLMIEGAGSETLGELKGLAQEALLHNAAAFCQTLNAVIARMEKDSDGGAAYLLNIGIGELQEALAAGATQNISSVTPASLGEDAELVGDFLVEAREHLSQIEGQMLVLERDPSEMEVIHAVFRAFHTIKGLAGFLDFPNVQLVAHEVETLLDLARNEKLQVTPPIVDVVLESGDFLQGELASIERALNQGGALQTADNRALVVKIRGLAAPRKAATSSPETSPAITPVVAVELVTPDAPSEPAASAPVVAAASKPKKAAPKKKKTAESKTFESPDGTGFIKLFSAADRTAMLSASMAESLKAPAESESDQKTADQKPAHQASLDPLPTQVTVPLMATGPAAPVAAEPAPPSVQMPAQAVTVGGVAAPLSREREPARVASPPPAGGKESGRPVDAGSVRVETAKLDHLMDMVGEIVIAQSLIRHNHAFAAATDSRLLADLAQLARVTGEVQRATMSMRMVPVGQLFQRVERVIRDLSRKAGKLVVMETAGSETEIDKTVAEELSDPLLHMVRNSVDHGIESIEERRAAGKSPEARIKLSARHQGGQVIIEISDDGRGLNSEKIRQKAEERHLITSNTQLTETEIYQLIFEPGFSTAEKITDVSGRGVGMDVVRRNVEKLRGRIETQSTLGAGTTFSLKLPLTLAIIDGLVVEVGVERYIIPLSGVREIFKPQSDALFTLEMREEMLLVRGQLMPVVRLGQRLGIEAKAVKPSDGLIVVVECQNKCFCLLVDDLLGKQEVVIKSLGETFKGVSGLSGCAVLGDGRVGLILDMDGIYRGGR